MLHTKRRAQEILLAMLITLLSVAKMFGQSDWIDKFDIQNSISEKEYIASPLREWSVDVNFIPDEGSYKLYNEGFITIVINGENYLDLVFYDRVLDRVIRTSFTQDDREEGLWGETLNCIEYTTTRNCENDYVVIGSEGVITENVIKLNIVDKLQIAVIDMGYYVDDMFIPQRRLSGRIREK